MNERDNKWTDKIRQLPLIVKIAAGVCVVALAAVAVMIVRLVTQKPETYTADSGSEAVRTEIATETAETEAVTEDASEIRVEAEKAVPSFSECKIKTESLERNLDIYITDRNDNPITGVAFQVKLLSINSDGSIKGSSKADAGAAEKSESGENTDETVLPESGTAASGTQDPYVKLRASLVKLADIQSRENELKQKMGSADFSTKDYEKVLIKKKKALDTYTEAINQVPDRVYTDEDVDGKIVVDSIASGRYALCFVPIENPRAAQSFSVVSGEENSAEVKEKQQMLLFDCGTYPMEVSVKESPDYAVLEHIMEKVSDSGAGDKKETHSDVKQQGKIKDTIAYTDEFSLSQQSDYSEAKIDPKELGISAVVSDEMNPGEPSQADTPELMVSSKVTLYANKAESASSAEMVCESSDQNEPEIILSDELRGVLRAEPGEEGYVLTLNKPAQISGDISGIVTVRAADTAGKVISAETEVEIIGSSTKLSHKKKGKLYVKEASGKIVRATVGNYAENVTFYIEKASTTVTYHGWQKKGKNFYYYDQNSQPVRGKQRIGSVDYTFDASSGKLLSASVAIDVSSWTGDVDWDKAACCVKSAIVRCGYRGTDGRLAIDTKHLTNVTQAKRNGIRVGMYFHSRATSKAQAVEEASLAVSVAKTAGGLNLPIYMELDSSVHGGMDRGSLTSIVKAFCSTVRAGGFRAGVSAGISTLKGRLDVSALGGVSVWCLQYNDKCTYKGSYDFWQYTNKGHIPGIAGEVSLEK